MGIQEITMELNNLKELIELIDSNLKFNISVFLTIMALFAAIAAGALYLWAKSIVEKSVQSQLVKIKNDLKQEIGIDIKPIKDELYELKSGLDQHVINLIDNRSKIKWSGGMFLSEDKQVFIGGLSGVVDWESPITSVRAIDSTSNKEIPIELIDKREDGFTFRTKQEMGTTKYLEWIIVWYDKSN